MNVFLAIVMFVIGLILLALGWLRLRNKGHDTRLWRKLVGEPETTQRFSPEMLADLPEPVRRYFRFSFEDGAELHTVVRLEMSGTLVMGGKSLTMRAKQIIAPPHGFIWRVQMGGALPVSGSDGFAHGQSWSRFSLLGFVPVVRASDTDDHRLSAYGRMVGEAVFWTPAAMLPVANAGWDSLIWEADGPDSAAVTARLGALETRAVLTVDSEGRPVRVVFDRWSNENAEKVFQLQPFGGTLENCKRYDGIAVPTLVHAGNHFGTPLYDGFFEAQITRVRFGRSPG